MKHLFIILFVSCNLIYAGNVDSLRARVYAENFLNNKSFHKSKIELKQVTLSSSNQEDFYLFNGKDCFILLSTDDRIRPVLAYSTEASFDTANVPHFIHAFLNSYSRQINKVVMSNSPLDQQQNQGWDGNGIFQLKGSKTSVSPLIATKWGQSPYYNDSCPGASVAGCVSIAMAQIMRYYQYPSSGLHFHSYNEPTYGFAYRNFENSSYNYVKMPISVKDTTNISSRAEVAKLIYHCGLSVNMTYSPTSSTSLTSDSRKSLTSFFKYNQDAEYIKKVNYSNIQWEEILKNELSNDRPVIYRGANSDGSSSHAFIVDGYDINNYYHVNWGWNGSYNGYFYLDALVPSSYDFSYDQAMIRNLKPSLSPNLSFPYFQGFETTDSSDYTKLGSMNISMSDKNSGMYSMYFDSSLKITEKNIFILKINVPNEPMMLSFSVKRKINSTSVYMEQKAFIRKEFWIDTAVKTYNLDTIYLGLFTDASWNTFNIPLQPYMGQNITLYLENYDNSTSRYQWMYLDDISVTPLSSIKTSNLEDLGYCYSKKNQIIVEPAIANLEVLITDILGKVVASDICNETMYYSLSKGIYGVLLKDNKGRNSSYKLFVH